MHSYCDRISYFKTANVPVEISLSIFQMSLLFHLVKFYQYFIKDKDFIMTTHVEFNINVLYNDFFSLNSCH